MSGCQRCGRSWGIFPSHAADAVVCLDCHCCAAARPDDDRVEWQAEVAAALRKAAELRGGSRLLEDRAVLVATSKTLAEAKRWLIEARCPGVEVEIS
jgi:hypothetical protein